MAEETDNTEARVARLEDEMRRLKRRVERAEKFKREHPDIALGEARKAAEAICKAIYVHAGCEKKGKPADKMMLDDLIFRLGKDNLIGKRIRAALGTIQRYGNLGAHDQGEESDQITPDDAVTCLTALSTVVNWYTEKYYGFDITPKPQEKGEVVAPDFAEAQGDGQFRLIAETILIDGHISIAEQSLLEKKWRSVGISEQQARVIITQEIEKIPSCTMDAPLDGAPELFSTIYEALSEAARKPWKEREDKDRAAELWERVQIALELKVRKIESSRLSEGLPGHDGDKLELHHRPYIGLVLNRDDTKVADSIFSRKDDIESKFGGSAKGFRLKMERNSAKKTLITLEDEYLTDRVLRNRKKNKVSGKKLPVTPAEEDWDDVCQFFFDNHSRFSDLISKHLEDAEGEKESVSSRSDSGTREATPLHAVEDSDPSDFLFDGNLAGLCLRCGSEQTFEPTSVSATDVAKDLGRVLFISSPIGILGKKFRGAKVMHSYSCTACGTNFQVCRSCMCPNADIKKRDRCDYCGELTLKRINYRTSTR